MKSTAIILIFGFVCQTSHAETVFEDAKWCLSETQFTDDYRKNLQAVEAVGRPEEADRLKDVSHEKLAAVFACVFKKQYPRQNLNNALKRLVELDDKVSEEERKTMLETLSTCYKNAPEDDTKLLNCVKVTASPFDNIIATIRDIPNAGDLCYHKCGVMIGKFYLAQICEIYKMEKHKNRIKQLLEILNEDKLVCYAGCYYDEILKKQYGSNFVKELTNAVTQSKKYNENQENELFEKINTCKTQVTEGEDMTYRLMQCLNIFKPPFLAIFP